MNQEVIILLLTSIGVGFIHTILGPDHYLPFIVMAKASKWSKVKTTVITFLCGIGHILSSVILGLIGIVLGTAVFKLQFLEAIRGEIAGWLLIIFGFCYFVYGIFQVIRNKPHIHGHLHLDGDTHIHSHTHQNEHLHIHSENKNKNLMPWILFTIFIFGPCEPLIPIIMYPAVKNSLLEMVLVIIAFGLTTIFTMLIIVLSFLFGLNKLPLARFEKWTTALAGFTILFCGVAIKFLGL